MSDRGTPRTWRHMNGYGSHTFLWTNAGGERFWVKYHFKTLQGIENFTREQAQAMKAEDPDHHRRDLLQAIERGDAPEWRLELQVMPYEEALAYRFNPFDVTKVWPHADYPPITVGRLVLDRNPQNYFAEVEQAAFAPANLVPGIGPSPDKMLLGRMHAYPDAQRYRIGTNYNQLPINAPRFPAAGASFDGAMRYRDSGPEPVYAPNSYGGPDADPALAGEASWHDGAGELGRYAYEHHADDDDFGQAGALFRNVMSDVDREQLRRNIADHLRQDVSGPVQDRAIAYWTSVDPFLGRDIATRLDRRWRSAA
jgi:catalase